jgi:group I intron endonuclease
MIIHNIYKIVNQTNGKTYIGYTSKKLQTRLNEHRSSSNKRNTKLYAAIRKHGWDNFQVEIIYQSLDGEYCLKTMEPYFIKEYDTFNTGYNLTEGGDGTLGTIPNAETRLKMSLAGKGKPSHRKGKKLPKETCIKMSESRIGEKNPNYNKQRTDDVKNKISETIKSQPQMTCSHCGKTTNLGNIRRWHGDNCKSLK